MPDNLVIETIMEQLRELRDESRATANKVATIASDVSGLRHEVAVSNHEQRIRELEAQVDGFIRWVKIVGFGIGILWPIVYPAIAELIRGKFHQ